jgi:uncharacterized membrane protein
MEPTEWIALWAVLFAATHFGLASAAVRPRLLKAIGEWPYRGLFSLVSFATLIPLIIEYFGHKDAGPILWMLGSVAPLRWLAVALAFAGLLLVVAGLANPSPAGMGAEISGVKFEARGVLRLTRHPVFAGLGLWAVGHMIVNGNGGSLLFFGAFAVVGIAGAMLQDNRKLVQLGEPYRRLVGQTSLIPGLAVLQGRQRLAAGEMPWVAIAIGAATLVILVAMHPVLFGGHPLG